MEPSRHGHDSRDSGSKADSSGSGRRVAPLDKQPVARRDPAMGVAPERLKAVEGLKMKIVILNWLTGTVRTIRLERSKAAPTSH